MATKFHYFSGRLFWAKVFEHNLDEYNGVKSAQIDIELDKEQLKALKASGSKVVPKLQDDGTMRVKFKRKFESPYEGLGGLPQVLNPDGTPLRDLIGNGSVGTVKVSVYETKMGNGTRLEAVRVDELIPYEETPSMGGTPTETDTQFLTGLPF